MASGRDHISGRRAAPARAERASERPSERASSEGRNPEDFAFTKKKASQKRKVEIMPLACKACITSEVIFRNAAI